MTLYNLVWGTIETDIPTLFVKQFRTCPELVEGMRSNLSAGSHFFQKKMQKGLDIRYVS